PFSRGSSSRGPPGGGPGDNPAGNKEGHGRQKMVLWTDFTPVDDVYGPGSPTTPPKTAIPRLNCEYGRGNAEDDRLRVERAPAAAEPGRPIEPIHRVHRPPVRPTGRAAAPAPR